MNSEANSEVKPRSYSVRELAGMGLPSYPGTERAWLDRVKNENWACVELKGQGRGGIRREYTPPPEVQALIDSILAANPNFFASQRKARRVLLANMSPEEANTRGCLAEKLNNESLAETLNRPLAVKLNEQYRMVPSATEYIDPARLREAVLLAARSEAVQPLTPDQRADMILSFYQHLSKPAQ